MSADLFAEFNSLSVNPTPPPQQTTAFQPTAHQLQNPPHQPPSQASANDPFSSLSANHAPLANPSPWAPLQAQSTGTSWGTSPAPSKSAQATDEDDDGWGDFEVAESTVQSKNQTQTHLPVSNPFSSTASFLTSVSFQPPHSNSPSALSHTSISDSSPPLGQAIHPAASLPQPSTRIVRASTMDLLSNNLVDIGTTARQQAGLSWSQQPTKPASQFEQYRGQPQEQQAGHQRRMKTKLKASSSKDPNVLFDAEDFELQVAEDDDDDDDDDDEFGDFETVSPAPAPASTLAQTPEPQPLSVSAVPSNPRRAEAPSTLSSMDLLSLDEPQQPPPQSNRKSPPSQLLGGSLAFGAVSPSYPQAPRSPSFQDRNPFPKLNIKTPTGTEHKEHPKPEEATPDTAWPSIDNPSKAPDNDDGWGAWDEFPANDSKQTEIGSSKAPESWDWDAVDNVQPPAVSAAQDDIPPPINVPPPSVILSIFPELLNSGNALFKPMTNQGTSIKQRVLSDPKVVDFLQGYVLLAQTAARVIAGRKQRWHRDKILTKSMSISAAGSKGMKLAGVDKTQSTREDREAADVVAVWRQQVGRLRSAVAAAKAAAKGPPLRVPELSENMAVQTAKMVPTSPKACIVCGLKREERVAKVDYEVEDSFGEWWTEHWGHKACRNFWLEHEQKLRQR